MARPARSYAGYLLISYDASGRVLGASNALVAAEPESSNVASAYEYSFEPAADVSVPGFLLSVELDEVLVPLVLVDTRHDIGSEVDDLLEVLGGHVEQVAEP